MIQWFSKERDSQKESILDIKTHYKPTETFQYTHFTSRHPPGVKRGFIKGEAVRLVRTNTSKTTFEEYLAKFKRGLEHTGIQRNIWKVPCQSDLKPQKHNTAERLVPFVTMHILPCGKET